MLRDRIVPLIIAVALFMENMDSTVIATSLPAIAADIGTNPLALKLAVTSYLLSLAIFIPASGWTADRFGARTVFRAAIGVFVIGSIGCALSSSLADFVIARIVQGIGGAMMTPVGRMVVVRTISKRELVKAMAWVTTPALIGPVLGPPVGGLITTYATWHWIFLINVPIGVITFAIAVPFVAESRGESRTRRLDLPGLVTSALALFALTYALIEGHDRGWTSVPIMAAFAVAALATAAFLAVEARTEEPMVPLPVFRNPVFSGGTVTMMIWGFGILGIYFFTSLYLQAILGFSPTKAGLSFVPMALCIALAATIAPRVVPVLGSHRTVSLGMLLMVAGLVLFARLGAGAGFGSLMPGFALFGLGAGLMNVPLTNSTLEASPTGQTGIASALLNASREVAGLLGVTVIGAVLRSQQASAMRGGASAPQAFLDGYHAGLWVTIGLLAAGVVLSYVTLRPRSTVAVAAGDEISVAELAVGEASTLSPGGAAGV